MPVDYDPNDLADVSLAEIEAWIGEVYQSPFAFNAHVNDIVHAKELAIWQAVTRQSKRLSDIALYDNQFINAGLKHFQRGAISAEVLMGDATYTGPDRIYSLTMGSGPYWQQISAPTSKGFVSPKVLKIRSGGTTNRGGVASAFEYDNPDGISTYRMRGRDVRFSGRLYANKNSGTGSINVRVAIVEHTGTADTPTKDIVSSWSSSTYTAGNFFINTNLNVLAVSDQLAIAHDASSVEFELDATVGASANNIIVMVWLQDIPAHASDYICVGDLGFHLAEYKPRIWTPRPNDLLCCLRYCEVLASSAGNEGMCTCHAYGTTGSYLHLMFKVEKRVVPTISYGTASAWRIRQVNTTYAVGAFNALARTVFSCNDYTSGDTAYASGVAGRLEASTSGQQIIIDAEL